MSIFEHLEPIIFIFYLILFSSLLYYFRAQQGSGLNISWVILIFILKVLAGCANVYVHSHDYVSNDIRFYFEQSVHDLKGFREHPFVFLRDLFFNWGDVTHHLNVFNTEDMRYLADLGPLIHTKFMNLANIFSFNTMYTDVIFFNMVYFAGALQLYKLFYRWQPQKKWLFVSSVFLIPSVMFWCSGIHKDGWVLASLGWVCYYAILFKETHKRRYIAGLFVAMMLLFASRYFIFLCFLPLFFCWWIWAQHPRRLIYFSSAYVVFIFIFFTAGKFTSIEPMNIIVGKQTDFLTLHGYSDMQTPLLETNVGSFIRNFPTALDHILLKPSFSLTASLKYQISSLDAWMTFILMLVMLFYTKRWHLQNLFYVMILFFGWSMYLFIGYTVPNCGALLRYKSEFTVLLLSTFVAISEVPFFKRFYTKLSIE